MVGIWKAAGERHPGAMNIVRSIEISSDRFSVSEHLKKILMNTAREIGLDLISTKAIGQRRSSISDHDRLIY